MSKVNYVDINALKLGMDDGTVHELWPHEYWILCPTRTKWVPEDGFIELLDFGMLRHNAKKACGLVLAQEDLLLGIETKSMKFENAKLAEDLLEKLRQEEFPCLPSRLRCHFLNYEKSQAEQRAFSWGWIHRSLERCYIVQSGGYFHHADVALFEQLTCDPENFDLARSYWQTFFPRADEFYRLEVLANSCLYFPDWRSFPEVEEASLASWTAVYGGNIRG